MFFYEALLSLLRLGLFISCYPQKHMVKKHIMFDANIALMFKNFAVALIPALLGIILHEVAHGWVASLRGDPTARMMGRLTLNPLPHIDPTGLLVFALTSLSGAFVFGWAKPVPVDPRYFKDPQKDIMWVSLAGPLTNLLLAAVFACLLSGLLHVAPIEQWKDSTVFEFVVRTLAVGIIINCGLCWLNLLPIPPLDGSKVLAYFLPSSWAWKYMSLGKYGFLILIVLLVTNILSVVLRPLVYGTNDFLLVLFGVK